MFDDQEFQIQYVDVVLPLALRQFYTYAVPAEFNRNLEIGKRVVVSFGKSKLYSAVIVKIHDQKPEFYETKPIEYILDDQPVVTLHQIALWRWMASYYMSTVGEIYKAALPTGLRLESELRIAFNQQFDYQVELKPQEEKLVKILSETENLSISEAAKLLNRKQILPTVKALQEKGAIQLSENIKHTYKEKLETYVRLSNKYNTESTIDLAFQKVGKAQKQEDLLLVYLSLSNIFQDNPKQVTKKFLLKQAGSTAAVLKAMESKGILEIYQETIGRLKPKPGASSGISELSEAQTSALTDLKSQFSDKDTILLHGVTASGKTELYIHLIQEYIEQGQTVLYLLPEIALTTQIIDRLAKVFGDKIGIYHSKYSDAERVEVWNEMLKGQDSKFKIILGVRSSIFLPLHNLGLIIVDEEHENTFKQFNPSPRYNARDVANVLAQIHKAKVLLGTASPSIETYFNAKQSKYGLVELNKRHQNVNMPEIAIVDMQLARKRKQMKSHFSNQLVDAIQSSLEEKKQVILFQNRRGYSPFVECTECGWVPQCEQCDVSLTYHKFTNDLQCHYCGYTLKMPSKCLACGSPSLSTKGFGTEKIEDEIKILFPDYKVARLDLDTSRKKYASEELIYQFERGEIDILVGTQMVSKGLDFKRVGLVAVLNADNMLNYPDFRAEERSFQLLTQVSGRAGRKDGQGKVLIQTSQPEHKIIRQVIQHDFKRMYTEQLQERHEFAYPPYIRLVELTLKHKILNNVHNAARLLVQELQSALPQVIILGPQAPVVNRIQNMYLQNILIKLPKTQEANHYKATILNRIDALKSLRDYRSLVVQVNVDPL
jgi:primosomal protein N' (replication factor Y)